MITSLHTLSFFFFFNDTATTEIYTLSLHDALPISPAYETTMLLIKPDSVTPLAPAGESGRYFVKQVWPQQAFYRSEEHTSELQSRLHLVCRLLLEKKKKKKIIWTQ